MAGLEEVVVEDRGADDRGDQSGGEGAGNEDDRLPGQQSGREAGTHGRRVRCSSLAHPVADAAHGADVAGRVRVIDFGKKMGSRM